MLQFDEDYASNRAIKFSRTSFSRLSRFRRESSAPRLRRKYLLSCLDPSFRWDDGYETAFIQLDSPPAIRYSTAMFAHYQLYRQLLRRDIAGKYRGTALGVVWSLLTPLLMLAVYTLVFSVVFKARWPLPDDQPQGQFALILFAGLIVHAQAAEVLLRASSAITAQVNYVKKVVFPLEILPLIPLGSALFHAGLSLVVLLAAMLLLQGNIPITALWLPVIWLPYLLALSGAAWILASLGVFLRDIGQLMGLVVTLLLFLSPVFYPAEALPEAYRFLLSFNPLTVIITQTRAVLLWGEIPDFHALGIYAVLAMGFAILGYAWFMKTRRGFADVL